MQGPGGMPAQHVLPVSIAPATIFMVDALDTETRALVAQGLFSVGSAAALAAAPASGPPVMGLCCLKRARGPTGQEDVKLQMLNKVGPLSIRDWHIACNRLQAAANAEEATDETKLGMALKALLQHMSKEGRSGVVHVLSRRLEKSPACGRICQEVAQRGIRVLFTALIPGSAGQDPLQHAQAAAAVSEFEESVAAADNASVQAVEAEPLPMERAFQGFLVQLLHTASTHLPPHFRPVQSLALVLPPLPRTNTADANIGGGIQASISHTVTSDSAAPLMVECTLSSQVLRWKPWLAASDTQPDATPTLASVSSAAASVANEVPLGYSSNGGGASVRLGPHQHLSFPPQVMSGLLSQASDQVSRLVLFVEQAIEAHELNASLTYGWPHLLTPYLEQPGFHEGSQGVTMAAVCQVLCSRGMLLLAWSMADIGEDGVARACSFKQWYALWPSNSEQRPSFLLKHIACREQLLPVAAASSGAQLSEHELQGAVMLAEFLQSRKTDAQLSVSTGFSPLGITSGVHTAMHELMRVALKK